MSESNNASDGSAGGDLAGNYAAELRRQETARRRAEQKREAECRRLAREARRAREREYYQRNRQRKIEAAKAAYLNSRERIRELRRLRAELARAKKIERAARIARPPTPAAAPPVVVPPPVTASGRCTGCGGLLLQFPCKLCTTRQLRAAIKRVEARGQAARR